jgi:hydrogenase small subunit
MTGVITYMLAFDRLPPLDRQGRPAMFYGQRLHDKCYRRPHFDAGQFVEKFDDEGARKGYCEWNGGLSWPVKSGHGCLGCAEDNFWDKGSFYSPVTNLGVTGNVESTADSIGGAIAGAAAIGVAAHAVISGIAKASGKKAKAAEEVSNG